METPERCVQSVESLQRHHDGVIYVVLVSLLLTLKVTFKSIFCYKTALGA